MNTPSRTPAETAQFIRSRIPNRGLFAGLDWRISPRPLTLPATMIREIEQLGRVLLQFNKAVNLLYRKSGEGKIHEWFAGYLDKGKPAELLELQRSPAFRNEMPRVIRPDILITDEGLKITELDSVPGGIGLTAWLNKTYSEAGFDVVGGSRGMIEGFASIFGKANRTHIIISKESETYVPEMEWLAEEIGPDRCQVHDTHFRDFQNGEAVYRFFELFDLPNIKNAHEIFERAARKEITVTAPPKTIFEEKMLFALLCNRNLGEIWRQQLGESFLKRLLSVFPYSWIVDPAPLPPHAAIPQLEITDWQQLKTLSQRERNLILKVSGFSESAWGARGVYLGSDLSSPEWSAAVDEALRAFARNPYVLQRYHRPAPVPAEYFDFDSGKTEPMDGRVRLCPYYFVSGEGDAARANLAGILATICPPDKKIIHGMRDAILAPVIAAPPEKD
jgi:hypothetical protein